MRTTLLYFNLIIIYILIDTPAVSQEILTGIEINQTLVKYFNEKNLLKSTKSGQQLTLPFFDDFSGGKIYPDPDKWTDNYAFINTDFPINPVSIGVATLDAIDNTGKLYPAASIFPFDADKLTSRPIDLNYSAADSIYLSFFYQPQGKGDEPQPHDSLRVEFYSPITETWNRVWSTPGNSLHEFKQVLIPVTDINYLTEGFKFRFSNIASIEENRFVPGAMSNSDHWHIDYVYLNKNRTISDTVVKDIAFIKPLQTLLNSYEAMPWHQFQAGRFAEMGSSINITYKNNDSETRSVRRDFDIRNIYDNKIVHTFSGGTVNIDPGQIQQFSGNLAYSFSSSTVDSAQFKIRAWLTTDSYDTKSNDTLTYYQTFNNYYAIDDGTSENGYGVFGEGAQNAMIALRFTAYKPDLLTAVKIFFNQTLEERPSLYFNLAIWDDANGKPGNLIYFQENERPVYTEGLNQFHKYSLNEPVEVSNVFYVGIIQNSSEFLNIGFDVNRNNSQRLFYNIHGNWINSAFYGSLMVRPVVNNINNEDDKSNNINISFNLYPNPVNDILNINPNQTNQQSEFTYTIYNLGGQIVFQTTGLSTRIDLSFLPPSIYIFKAQAGNAIIETRKIVIVK